MSFYGGKQGRTYHLVKHFKTIAAMKSEFADGGQYTEVLYGQYVIIDTDDKADPSNGIIYRRGFNYQATGATEPTQEQWTKDNEVFQAYIADPGNGAIYIGQVVGPSGAAPIVSIASSTVNSTELPSVASTVTRDNYGTNTEVDLTFKIPILQITPSSTTLASHENVYVQEQDSSTAYPFKYDLEFGIPKGIHGKSIEEIGINSETTKFAVKYRDYQESEGGNVDSNWTDISPYNVISTITASQIDNTLAYQMNVDYTYTGSPSSTFVPTQIRTVSVNSSDPSQLDLTLQTQEDIVPISVKIPSASFKVWGIYTDYPENPPSDHTPSSTTWETGDIIRIEASTTTPAIEDGFYMYDPNSASTWIAVFASMSDPTKYIQIGTLAATSSLYNNGVLLLTSNSNYYWED